MDEACFEEHIGGITICRLKLRVGFWFYFQCWGLNSESSADWAQIIPQWPMPFPPTQWHMLAIPAFRRLRLEDLEFEVSVDYKEIPYFKILKK